MFSRKQKTKIEFNRLDDYTLKVGYPASKSKASALDKAVSNNFGAGNIPTRPFMDISFNNNVGKYTELLNKSFSRVDDIDTAGDLNKIGIVAVNDIQNTIEELRDPPNSLKTIETKGSSNPLIDTGEMIQAVTYEVNK